MAGIRDLDFGECIYRNGDIIKVKDAIDPKYEEIGTIKFIERDTENPSLFWLYIIANEETLNNKMDPKYGIFWQILEHSNNRIELLSRAVQ
jgi:hypothetical protein